MEQQEKEKAQTNKLIGKTVKAVYPIYGNVVKEDANKKDRLDNILEGEFLLLVGDYDDSGGETVIEFTDGTYITIWASEWGGIVYRKGNEDLSKE